MPSATSARPWWSSAGWSRKAHYFISGSAPQRRVLSLKHTRPRPPGRSLDGHVSAFAFLGGVPQSVLYDNTELAVAREYWETVGASVPGPSRSCNPTTCLRTGSAVRARATTRGRSRAWWATCGATFWCPSRPSRAFTALNAHLERRCLERMDATLRGHSETIGQRMERDLDALLPLPPVPYDACDRQAGRVSSLSLVRYRTNDYSVPVAYGHRDVMVRGYVDQVVISCGV